MVNVPKSDIVHLPRNRIASIDVAKGIGIILVVVMHSYFCFDAKSISSRVIGSFPLPLFFFLSGLFFHTRESLGTNILRKMDGLLKPVFITAILWAPISLFFMGDSMVKSLFPEQSFLGAATLYFVSTFAGIAFYSPNGQLIHSNQGLVPTWFVIHLFAIHLFSVMVAKSIKWDRLSLYLRAGFAVCLLFAFVLSYHRLGYEFSLWNANLKIIGLPFSVDLLLFSASWYLLGSALRTPIEKLKPNLFVAIFSGCIYVAAVLLIDTQMNMFWRAFKNVPFSILQVAIGIFAVVSLAVAISKYHRLSAVLSYIGARSMFVLIFHVFFLVPAFAVTSKKLHILPPLAAMISIVFAIIGSLFVASLVKKSRVLTCLYFPVQKT